MYHRPQPLPPQPLFEDGISDSYQEAILLAIY